jgi:D-serine deaminase-like pyridoxal phosphate-dependent protein
MPLGLDRIQDAHTLTSFLKPHGAHFRVFIDSLAQLQALHEYTASQAQFSEQGTFVWSVMIKLDGGTRRAGFTLESDDLKRAVEVCLDSPHIDLFGFYAHFGREYIPLSNRAVWIDSVLRSRTSHS